jgi:TRAP-type transport system periplasmic protein
VGGRAPRSNGRVDVSVHPENDKLQGGDLAALKMLIDGEIQFFTLMGGIIGTVVPVAEAQQVPFALRTESHAHGDRWSFRPLYRH